MTVSGQVSDLCLACGSDAPPRIIRGGAWAECRDCGAEALRELDGDDAPDSDAGLSPTLPITRHDLI